MWLLFKNTFKKIKKASGRFLSIMFIIALGISVFMGLRESTASMLYTADNYYDENNLMDFKITSTHGFTQADITALKALSNRKQVVATYALDVLVKGEAIRVHALEDTINNVMLIKGQLPKNNKECVADFYNYKLNDVITFENDDLDTMLTVSSCKVVGLVKSALYVRAEKGISNVGNGKLVSFLFLNKDAFKGEYYTEVYITAKGAKESNSYFADYEDAIKPLREELKELKPIRETIRYEEILREAHKEITKIKQELDLEIEAATLELETTKLKLDQAQKQLETNKTNTLAEFTVSKKELSTNKTLLLANLNNMNLTELELNNYILNLTGTISNLKEQLLTLELNSDEYNDLSIQIIELETNYNALVIIQAQLAEINEGLKIWESNYNLFLSEIEKEEVKLRNGYNSYEGGIKELEVAKTEAKERIEEAKGELTKIEKPVWYLLDRTNNSGYLSYKEDIIKVDAIAKILPVFFIIVVILMTLNTLTRLIEEERTEMGILQANGFTKASIIVSYLFYVLTAGLIGIGIGLTVGYSIIPQLIYSVFLGRYYVPKLITIISPLPFSLVITVTLTIMIVVTIIACWKELKEVPATLLRPKPPKLGKRIFIEKFNLFWSKLSFMGKTTIRNLFRYKKRVIMAILGVAGCTSLLVAGMGLKDSINVISKLQYKEIIKYDTMCILKNEIIELPNELSEFLNKNKITESLLINHTAYTFTFADKIEDVYVIVPVTVGTFSNYVNLTSTITNKEITIPKTGAVITKQLADHLKVKVGDSISIRNSDNELFILSVSDIVYNYVAHYIYVSDYYYQEVFKTPLSYNSIITIGEIDSNINLSAYDILVINYTSDIIQTFNSFVSSLNTIIIMIVVLACFLAFVVLYNLTVINVSERKREIATFKVLGFYEQEVSMYIYRETLILTFVGIILGLFLGTYLHQFIIVTAETDNIVFLREINTLSYVLSALITIVFSFIVQLIINNSLKKINMVTSLKAVE